MLLQEGEKSSSDLLFFRLPFSVLQEGPASKRVKMKWHSYFLSILSAAAFANALIGHEQCVSFTSGANAGFPIVSGGNAAPIYISASDSPSVHRALKDFVSDIGKVSGKTPQIFNTTSFAGLKPKSKPIIVGTVAALKPILGNSTADTIQGLEGKWESYVGKVVKNPLPGVPEAYVLLGSDRRAVIYGLYELSEQSGVSPWYWWADVPIQKHSSIFASTCQHGSPSVKYRGIFINDEQPAIQSWAQEKFTNGTGQPFNHQFYEHVFELILRLKGNYLWPAMWGAMFNVDDPLNQYTADFYGVVMGTSHHEPMMRATPNEWYKLYGSAWNWTTNSQLINQYMKEGAIRARPYESLFTMGMRGDGDLPLQEDINIGILEDIVAHQRTTLSEVFNTTDLSTIPQVWTLYQEVQGYYEKGMKVPDDITLLWSDDNWGNIRRFPLESERNRKGGAGIYYHFDFVGGPRCHKWAQTTQLEKVYEQMGLAYARGADRIWIVNVGDIKPYEYATEFFINLGYNATRWNQNTIKDFVTTWATREFSQPSKSPIIADIIANATRFNARRKPEFWNATTYSLIDYRESENWLNEWSATLDASTAIYNSLSSAAKIAYFELVHHTVRSSSNLANIYVNAGRNNLYASQARISTNDLADLVEKLFEADYDIENQYHTMLDGKWNHMMDQTHIGYYYWQQPMANTMPAINRVHSRKQALAGPMRITIEGNRGAWPGDNPYQCDRGYNCPPPTLRTFEPYTPRQSRYIDVSAGGPSSFTFKAAPNATWIKISATSGSITRSKPDFRLEVSPDWSKISDGQTAAGEIVVTSSAKGQNPLSVTIYVNAKKTAAPGGFKGFVEADGAVSIEAAHATSNKSVSGVSWTELPRYGKTLSAVTPLPATANGGAKFAPGTGPSLSYSFYTFNPVSKLTSYISPSLNSYGTDRPLSFAVQIDSETPQTVTFIPPADPGKFPKEWDGDNGFVANNIVTYTTNHSVAPGAHTLKIYMIEPAVVLQKFVLNTGGVRASYLGPPESRILS